MVTLDMRGMTGLNSMCKRVLNLLEAGYLRLREVVVNRITVIKFGMNKEVPMIKAAVEMR